VGGHRYPPGSINDFRTISLCNSVYKVIATRIKPILFAHISKEQFGFLSNMKILYATGVVEESIHSIKVKKLKGMILKINLIKAYDRVDWTYLGLILFQIGLPLNVVNWIIACVTFVNFAVLINGSPAGLFKGFRGLIQGCPMSPLLFVLVIEGLNRFLGHYKEEGLFYRIKFTKNLNISHLLFVDDVLIFGRGRLKDQEILKYILQVLCDASGMEISEHKFVLIQNNVDTTLIRQIVLLFPFHIESLDSGLKYLGFFLNPNCYKKEDWGWLVWKIDKIMGLWTYKWISLGGRLNLLKYVL
jgi:hypothetical protein